MPKKSKPFWKMPFDELTSCTDTESSSAWGTGVNGLFVGWSMATLVSMNSGGSVAILISGSRSGSSVAAGCSADDADTVSSTGSVSVGEASMVGLGWTSAVIVAVEVAAGWGYDWVICVAVGNGVFVGALVEVGLSFEVWVVSVAVGCAVFEGCIVGVAVGGIVVAVGSSVNVDVGGGVFVAVGAGAQTSSKVIEVGWSPVPHFQASIEPSVTRQMEEPT